MRPPRFLQTAIALAFVASASLAHAQTITQTTTVPKLPFPAILEDSLLITYFGVNDGASYFYGGLLSLNHRLAGGIVPTQYRASIFADFHDASWLPYPSTTPSISHWLAEGQSTEGTLPCSGASITHIAVYFQVRGPIPNTRSWRTSRVALDDICFAMPG